MWGTQHPQSVSTGWPWDLQVVNTNALPKRAFLGRISREKNEIIAEVGSEKKLLFAGAGERNEGCWKGTGQLLFRLLWEPREEPLIYWAGLGLPPGPISFLQQWQQASLLVPLRLPSQKTSDVTHIGTSLKCFYYHQLCRKHMLQMLQSEIIFSSKAEEKKKKESQGPLDYILQSLIKTPLVQWWIKQTHWLYHVCTAPWPSKPSPKF